MNVFTNGLLEIVKETKTSKKIDLSEEMLFFENYYARK